VIDSQNQATSPAELLGRPSWVLFDGLSAKTIEREWQASVARVHMGDRRARDLEVSRLTRLAESTGKFELVAMYKLLARTLQQNLEGLVRLISHDMNDITEVIHPHRWGFEQDSWDMCRYAGGRFKDFILEKNPIAPYTDVDDKDAKNKAFSKLLSAANRRDVPNRWEPQRLSSLRTALAPLLNESRT